MERVQLVVFEMDGKEFGMDARLINGIVRTKRCKIQQVPNMPREFEGIISLQGNVSYILNLRNKLNLENKPIKEESKILMAYANDLSVGWVVDEIKDVVYFDAEEITRVTDYGSSMGFDYIDAIGTIGERRIMILDSGRLLAETGMRQAVNT
jgi:purine-binding chemotaxis protein CheW